MPRILILTFATISLVGCSADEGPRAVRSRSLTTMEPATSVDTVAPPASATSVPGATLPQATLPPEPAPVATTVPTTAPTTVATTPAPTTGAPATTAAPPTTANSDDEMVAWAAENSAEFVELSDRLASAMDRIGDAASDGEFDFEACDELRRASGDLEKLAQSGPVAPLRLHLEAAGAAYLAAADACLDPDLGVVETATAMAEHADVANQHIQAASLEMDRLL